MATTVHLQLVIIMTIGRRRRPRRIKAFSAPNTKKNLHISPGISKVIIVLRRHRHLEIRPRSLAKDRTETASSARPIQWPAPTASGPNCSASRTLVGMCHRWHLSLPAAPPSQAAVLITTPSFEDTAIVANRPPAVPTQLPSPVLLRLANWAKVPVPSPPSATSHQVD